jgi:hypothetical protein
LELDAGSVFQGEELDIAGVALAAIVNLLMEVAIGVAAERGRTTADAVGFDVLAFLCGFWRVFAAPLKGFCI